MINSIKRNLIITLVLLVTVYVTSYVWFRNQHAEVWNQDGQAYVLFPKDRTYIYYFYRPLTYIDGPLTGMRFHIGPHQESTPAM